ncbi:MAG: tetratricopeptide repeat protein, partial [Nitrospinae bacterium]|nr:tetratricopeptide repeat protein [Nitrospinota bacterium]
MAEQEQSGLVSIPDYFRNGYILVVDDARNMRKTMKGVLRHLGVVSVHEADDGDTALHMISTIQEKCLLIFLDWAMPRMNGILVAKELKGSDKTKDIPILMVTADGNYSQVTYAGEFGVEGYVMKPFGATVLEEKITGVLVDRLHPPNYLKLLRAGEKMFESGQVEKAMAYFNESLKYEESARAFTASGFALEKMGRIEEAERAFRASVERNPQYLRGLQSAAEFLVRIGKEGDAVQFFKTASEISPNNPERHLIIGTLSMKTGDEDTARLAFQEAIKHDPTKSTVIAEELLKTGKAELAEVYFRWSLDHENHNVHVYNRLGIALRRQGKWKEAVDEYKLALAIDPEDEVIY